MIKLHWTSKSVSDLERLYELAYKRIPLITPTGRGGSPYIFSF